MPEFRMLQEQTPATANFPEDEGANSCNGKLRMLQEQTPAAALAFVGVCSNKTESTFTKGGFRIGLKVHFQKVTFTF